MEALNHTLFLWINAAPQTGAAALFLGKICAEYLVYLIPLTLVVGWLWGEAPRRRALLAAALTAVLGLALSFLISQLYQHPRPFAIGLGTNFLPHAPDSSFPSDHLTFTCSVAFSLLLYPATRRAGLIFALMALPMAWGRIFLGVHYPFDMLGAALLGLLCARVLFRLRHVVVAPLYELVNRLYQLLFGPLIRKGWVNR